MNAYTIPQLANNRHEDYEREAAHDRLVEAARAARSATRPVRGTRAAGPLGALIHLIRSNPRISRFVAALTAG